MKTINMRSRSNWMTAFAVIGGLTALYFYRRGSFARIPALASGALATARNQIQDLANSAGDKAQNLIDQVKGPVADAASKVESDVRKVKSDVSSAKGHTTSPVH